MVLLFFLSFLHNILSSFHLSCTHRQSCSAHISKANDGFSIHFTQVHTYTVHTNLKCFRLCIILFQFRASFHLCSSCKRAKVRHLAFFCVLLLFGFLIGFFFCFYRYCRVYSSFSFPLCSLFVPFLPCESLRSYPCSGVNETATTHN